MRDHVVIISLDDVFSRMLELEFRLFQLSTRVIRDAEEVFFAEVALLDLDSMPAPTNGTYSRMIGFTRSSALSADDARRQCAMILHRPFQMNILRREVFDILHQNRSEPRESDRILIDVNKPERHEHIRLILKDGKLFYGEKNLSLSNHEARILEALIAKKGEAASREELSALIGESSANKVDVYICYLRKKIENAFGVRLIGTVRKKGYRLL